MTNSFIEFSDLMFSDIELEYPFSLGEGGYGCTWRVKYRPKGAVDEDFQDVVLKVLKTTTNPKAGSNPHKDFIEEIQLLRKLRHQGIVRVIRQGTCKIKEVSTLYYLAEWEEALPLDRLLKSSSTSIPVSFAYNFLESILNALSYCHQNCIIHLDIKPDNILIKFRNDSSEQTFDHFDHCTLIDFGKAKALPMLHENESSKTTVGGGNWEYVHKNLRPFLRSNTVDKILFEYGPAGFDLFSISRILEKNILPRLDSSVSRRDIDFLVNLIDELRNSTVGKPEFRLFSAQDGLDAIQRFRKNPEPFKKSFRLSLGITVGTTALVREIIDTPEFQRLRKVSQLSLTHLVYPSATHTRFSHSIGAYHMAGRYVDALFQDPLFSIRYSQHDIDILKIRALLHDIGHYPMAHYFEEFGNVLSSNGNYIRFNHGIYYGNSLKKGNLTVPGSYGKSLANVLRGAGIQEETMASEATTLLDAIIDGPVDCDKLDYLIRDGLSCGVPYADSIDVDRFLSSLTWYKDDDKKCLLAVTTKGITAAETILTARYHLFSEVYWHKTCRAAVAMIKEAFFLAYKAEAISQDELDRVFLGNDDHGVLQWLAQTLEKSNPEAASDLITNALIPGNSRSPYKRIVTYAKSWASEITGIFYSELGRYGIDRLFELKKKLIEELNGFGRTKLRSKWVEIKPHHIVIDMPPNNKDTLGELYVKYQSNVSGKTSASLSEISSIIKTLSEMFSQKICRVRIYCHPACRDQVLTISNQNAREFFDKKIISFFKG